MIMMRAVLFLLITALCAVSVVASNTGGTAVFVNPPPAVDWHGEEPSFASDTVWTLGETQLLQWTATYPQFNIEIWQQMGENSGTKGATIFGTQTERPLPPLHCLAALPLFAFFAVSRLPQSLTRT